MKSVEFDEITRFKESVQALKDVVSSVEESLGLIDPETVVMIDIREFYVILKELIGVLDDVPIPKDLGEGGE